MSFNNFILTFQLTSRGVGRSAVTRFCLRYSNFSRQIAYCRYKKDSQSSLYSLLRQPQKRPHFWTADSKDDHAHLRCHTLLRWHAQVKSHQPKSHRLGMYLVQLIWTNNMNFGRLGALPYMVPEMPILSHSCKSRRSNFFMKSDFNTKIFMKGSDHLGRFLGSQWDRQLKFSANASF